MTAEEILLSFRDAVREQGLTVPTLWTLITITERDPGFRFDGEIFASYSGVPNS